jgi:hypothetical protein
MAALFRFEVKIRAKKTHTSCITEFESVWSFLETAKLNRFVGSPKDHLESTAFS